MASGPIIIRRRRKSIGLPLMFSKLHDKVNTDVDSFTELFDISEPEMRRIVADFQRISEEVKTMQRDTDIVRKVGGGIGVVAGIAGIVGGIAGIVGVLAAPLTGGTSLLVAGAAVGGGVGVVVANISKKLKENGSMKKVEERGKDFMKLVEPLKEKLEGIQTTCKQFEESVDGAENTLKDVEEMKEILRRVSELRKKSRGALDVAVSVLQNINQVLVLIVAIFIVLPTPEQDKKLRESIIQSADQSQKVVDEFNGMKRVLEQWRLWLSQLSGLHTNQKVGGSSCPHV
ncbi:uncharacterized protein [Embiotoca jacksoni]|uniref:uncharacterized protein n=1 Tax=Embiotoca jacksoni TaxID=100190 RepID=UPI003703C2BC